MKPVQVEFVEPRAWKFIWAVATLVLFAIAAITAVQTWRLHQQRTALEREIATVQTLRLQRLAQEKQAETPQGNPRAASEAAAYHLLRLDWNVLYDSLEIPELSKVRLVQLSFDAMTGIAMLEYELDNLEQAAGVATALNEASSRSGVWRLERLDNGAQSNSLGGATTKVKGVWRAQVTH